MIAFEVLVNGQRRFTAGGDYPTLTATLTLVRIPMPKPNNVSIFFSASGITPEPQLVVGAWPAVDLNVGDRVEIRVVEIAAVDVPESVQTFDRADDNVGS
jgi:protein involved in polysaccharide export with SLBB domain